MDETRTIAEKSHAMRFADLPEEVIDRTKYLMLDFLGVAARGSRAESSIPVQKMLSRLGSGKEGGVVIGTGLRASPPYAALANGTSAHAIELDDVVNAASLHPAVAVMPAALAAAEITGCTGAALIAAIVLGYETAVRLGIALNPSAHYARGFHPTATCGTFAAAVAAARILRLEFSGMLNALGIAGSQAAGSMEFLSDGAFTKRFHAGWAAHAGLMAALLAREGFTGPGTILEGKFGFLKSYSPEGSPEKVLEDWGKPYQVMRTSIKPHACCRYNQGPIDGILELMRKNRIVAGDIAQVTLGILKAGFALVADPEERKRRPESIVDAQFSAPFAAAVAILHGKAFFGEYSLENIASPEVRALMGRVRCVEDPSLEAEFPAKWPASVTITLKSGEAFATRVEYPKGDPENPLSWEELIEKFHFLSAPVFTPEKREEIVRRVRRLERAEDIATFVSLL
jgi:2-methylcitrate dehydratase PrpD